MESLQIFSFPKTERTSSEISTLPSRLHKRVHLRELRDILLPRFIQQSRGMLRLIPLRQIFIHLESAFIS